MKMIEPKPKRMNRRLKTAKNRKMYKEVQEFEKLLNVNKSVNPANLTGKVHEVALSSRFVDGYH